MSEFSAPMEGGRVGVELGQRRSSSSVGEVVAAGRKISSSVTSLVQGV